MSNNKHSRISDLAFGSRKRAAGFAELHRWPAVLSRPLLLGLDEPDCVGLAVQSDYFSVAGLSGGLDFTAEYPMVSAIQPTSPPRRQPSARMAKLLTVDSTLVSANDAISFMTAPSLSKPLTSPAVPKLTSSASLELISSASPDLASNANPDFASIAKADRTSHASSDVASNVSSDVTSGSSPNFIAREPNRSHRREPGSRFPTYLGVPRAPRKR